MRFSARDKPDEQFQIAPMMDVVFLLLIFFIATYAASQEEKLLNIKLPKSTAAEDEVRSTRETIVNLDAQGNLTLYRRRIDPAELETRLKLLRSFTDDPGVIIRADGDCPHRYVIMVMDLCARTRIRRVFFSTVEKKDEENRSPQRSRSSQR